MLLPFSVYNPPTLLSQVCAFSNWSQKKEEAERKSKV